jgi:phage tail sheath protein FI
MATLARLVNGAFRCMALTDLPTNAGDNADSITDYADAGAWKTDNGYTSVDQVACWPKLKNGADVYHLSTILACVANLTDATVNGVPYLSPSNKPVVGTAAVLDDGAEVLLEEPQATTLNESGIVTVLNSFEGWVLWGNRTAGYPGTTDPKDAFISIRRMFNWIENTIQVTSRRDIDSPVNLRFVRSVLSTLGSFLNALVTTGALVDGKIEFRKDENPTIQLADGHVVWHVTATPPSPAEQMEFVTEYDPAALAELFAA